MRACVWRITKKKSLKGNKEIKLKVGKLNKTKKSTKKKKKNCEVSPRQKPIISRTCKDEEEITLREWSCGPVLFYAIPQWCYAIIEVYKLRCLSICVTNSDLHTYLHISRTHYHATDPTICKEQNATTVDFGFYK